MVHGREKVLTILSFTPKVKDRIVRTFSRPCTTHPVVLDEEHPRKKIE
jgi:hypothetical protein